MSTPTTTDDLSLALRLAELADSLSLPRFTAGDLHVTAKPDLSPVTDADLAVESALRELLAKERPGDSIQGEEYGLSGSSGRRWIIDPIDGTKNFVRGTPVWATLIALYEEERPLLGVVSAPALARRWHAGTGLGAWSSVSGSEPVRLSVSGVADLADASFSYSSLSGWATLGIREPFLALTDQVWRTRAYGDFWSYVLVAEGAVDLAAEPELALHDMAALVPIVLEAGGRFTDLEGRDGPWGPNAIASNGLLHEAALKALS